MANHLKPDKKVLVVSMLAEGASIRAIERITGIHRDTIMRLGVRVGESCHAILDAKMRNLNCRRIELDEIWGFIGKKQKHLKGFEQLKGLGDAWTFIALDPDSKLIPAYQVGIRCLLDVRLFIDSLAMRLANRIQVSSDQLQIYPKAIERGFGQEIDYAQIVKTYSVTHLNKDAASRYSPAQVVKVERRIISGAPDVKLISTSHVEKQNHTLRMHCRRLTRLTNAFSKKYDNFHAAIALNFAYYNFCKRHLAVRMTPAQAAGVETSQWTVAQLIERCGE